MCGGEEPPGVKRCEWSTHTRLGTLQHCRHLSKGGHRSHSMDRQPCCMLLFLYLPVTCNPSRVVTLPSTGVPHYICRLSRGGGRSQTHHHHQLPEPRTQHPAPSTHTYRGTSLIRKRPPPTTHLLPTKRPDRWERARERRTPQHFERFIVCEREGVCVGVCASV